MIKAVITGDIISSSEIGTKLRQRLYLDFGEYVSLLSKSKKKFEGEMGRGDWFQCLVHNPADSLRYTLKLKCYLRSFALLDKQVAQVNASPPHKLFTRIVIDSRVAIGIGSISFRNKTLGGSDGEAFQLSGRLLDALKSQRQTMGIAIEDMSLQDELQTIVILLDAIIQKNTPAQSQVILRKLDNKTETEIAQELKVAQSAISQHSTAGSWRAIEAAVNHFEKKFAQYAR